MTQEQTAGLEALIAQWRADAQHDVEDAMEAEGKALWVTAGGLLARADQRRTDANELESALSALRALREGTTPFAALKGALRGDESDADFDAAVATVRDGLQEDTHAICHDLVCNGDRAYPRGAKGRGCSCVSREKREAATVQDGAVPASPIEASSRSALDLAPIKAREQAAAKGPWQAENAQDGIEDGCAWGVVSCDELVIMHDFVAPFNAEFIAHARQDIPALIAEIEHLRAAHAVPSVSSPEKNTENDE